METQLFEIRFADSIFSLCRALGAEDLTFALYVNMLATARRGRGPSTLSEISLDTGYSMRAIRLQVLRSHWWKHSIQDRTTYVTLTEEGLSKLSKIHRLATARVRTKPIP